MVIDSSEKIISYEIISPLGQSIFKGDSEASLNEFLPSLSPATYLLNITADSGKRQTIRFVKK